MKSTRLASLVPSSPHAGLPKKIIRTGLQHKIPRNRSLKTTSSPALPPPHPPQAAPVHHRIKRECLEIFSVSQDHPNISTFIQSPTNWKTHLISLCYIKSNHLSRPSTNTSLSRRFLFIQQAFVWKALCQALRGHRSTGLGTTRWPSIALTQNTQFLCWLIPITLRIKLTITNITPDVLITSSTRAEIPVTDLALVSVLHIFSGLFSVVSFISLKSIYRCLLHDRSYLHTLICHSAAMWNDPISKSPAIPFILGSMIPDCVLVAAAPSEEL